MSSDNDIYIIQTSTRWGVNEDGSRASSRQQGEKHPIWRVTYAISIDTVDWIAEHERYNLAAYILDKFKNSPVFRDEKSAQMHAFKLADNIGYTEYGVCFISGYEDLFLHGD